MTVKSLLKRRRFCTQGSEKERNFDAGYLDTYVWMDRRTWAKGTNYEAKHDFDKFKRSLSLLGFEFAELWPKKQVSAERRPVSGPAVATRVLSRSISSERLREEVIEARREGRIDDDRRRLLARAAYEEWYFQRVGDAKKKIKSESAERRELQEKLEKESEIKNMKAKAEFQKWLKRKETEKRNDIRKKKSKQSDLTLKTKLTTRQVEQQKAFDDWHRKKENEIKRQKAEKLREEERKLQIEGNKKERKATAEQVFRQWKQKLEEREREKTKKAKSQNNENRLAKKMNERKSQSQKVFLIWKNKKDNELKEKQKLNRMRLAFISGQEAAEERMAQAQTAFELWLTNVEKRSRKIFQGEIMRQTKPWIPL